MEKWISLEHGLMFPTALAVFGSGLASVEYSFYWLIRDAGLPPNITDICALDSNATGCDTYDTQVVAESVKLSQLDSLKSLLILCLTWWLGTASDVIGKRRILLLNYLGLFLAQTTQAMVVLFEWHPIYLIICGACHDLVGGLAITITVVLASVTSRADHDNRLYKIILVDLAFLLPSLIMTPVGVWIKKYGLDYVYYIQFTGAFLVLLASITCFACYKDTYVTQSVGLGQHFKQMGQGLKDVWLRWDWNTGFLWTLVVSFFLRLFSSTGASSITQLYLQSPPFSWDSELYAIFTSTTGVLAFFSFIVVGFMSSCKLSNFTILYVSYLSFVVYFILFGSVTTTHSILLISVIRLFHDGTLSITRTMMAETVDKGLHGTLFVIPGVFQNIAYATGQLTFSQLYKELHGHAECLFKILCPFLFALATFFLVISHYIRAEKVNLADEDDDQALLDDSDANSESFSEFDPNATPID